MQALEKATGLELELDSARITRLPDEAFYITDFITEDEEERLLRKIPTAPLPTWKTLSHRRVQTYPSALSPSNALLASPLPPWLSNPIIPRFQSLRLFSDSPHKEPNHVLVNEYRPGQGIMPHEDGAAYYPLVATVSLGGVVVLDLYPKERQHEHDDKGEGNNVQKGDADGNGSSNTRRQPKYRILQEQRSLLVTRGSIYGDYLHGIAEIERDEDLNAESICNWDLLGARERFGDGYNIRETRVSLTYRDVLKVSKVGGVMKFLNKK
ncbi:uncharacterized protein BDV17DRAFT_103350 [Aspergillus undulatus]|uniref:uncharacterized protein n=1 Tax=Aspergillus undulatus TaxID=1810928 RepID=UPI003CCE0AD8